MGVDPELTSTIERVIRALVYLRSTHPDTDRISQGLGYFRGHRHRMRYADAKRTNAHRNAQHGPAR